MISSVADPVSNVLPATTILAAPAKATRSRSARRTLHSSAWTVLVVGALITALLAASAQHVHTTNENRLLKQRAREVASVPSSSLTAVQLPLASAAVVAEATGGDAAAFRKVVAD